MQCIWEVIVAQYLKANRCLPPVLFLLLDEDMRGSTFMSLSLLHFSAPTNPY